MSWRPTTVVRGLAAFGVVAASLVAVVGPEAEPVSALEPSDVVVTGEIFAPTSASSCSGQSATSAAGIALRTAVDAQDDGWTSQAAANGDTEVVRLELPAPTLDPDQVDVQPTPIVVPSADLTVFVSKRDFSATERDSLAPNSIGTADLLSYRDPYAPAFGTSASASTLQDCAPRPQSLYDGVSTPQPRMWNATGGDGSTFDAAFFEFSRPVSAFGAWFGDVETRTDPWGEPAKLKLFDADGNVIHSADIPTTTTDQSNGCGGPDIGTDQVGCGNQATRWIGFASPDREVAAMAVIVGEDDACEGSGQPNPVIAAQCNGFTEHLSWIGATVALGPAELTVDKQLDQGPGPHLAGTQLDFSITVTNGGDLEANPLTVDDAVPGGLIVSSASGTGWTCSVTGQQISCVLDAPLPSGATTPPINVVTTITTDSELGEITNTATATHVVDGNDVSATDAVAFERTPQADLEASKLLVADPGPDGHATWLIGVENLGADPAVGVVVADSLPPSTEIASITAPGWMCETDTGDVVCELDGPLDAGDTALIVIATINPAGPLHNSANVSADTYDPRQENNGASASGDVPSLPTTTTATTLPVSSTTAPPPTASTTIAPNQTTTAPAAPSLDARRSTPPLPAAAPPPAPAPTPRALPAMPALPATGAAVALAASGASVTMAAGVILLGVRRRRD